MTKIIWLVFALFLIGNSFFVLSFHFSNDSITNNYVIRYKKDSVLLRTVFPDSIIQLKLNMPPLYDALYYKNDSSIDSIKQNFLMVNVSFFDNLDFFSLTFPFYKSIRVKGEISFYSIIKIEGQPFRDSMALIGYIIINSRLVVKGICTPLYARTLVEKELVSILRKEMNKVKENINRQVITDTSVVAKPVKKIRPRKRSKPRKK